MRLVIAFLYSSLCLCLLSISCLHSYSQDIRSELVLATGTDEYNACYYAGVFTDTLGKLSFEEIKQGSFTFNRKEVLNLGFNTYTHWIKIVTNNKNLHKERNWILHTHASHISYIDLFTSDTFYRTGVERQHANRPSKHREFAFPVRLTPGGTDTFYFKIKSYRPNVYSISLQTPDRWLENAEADTIFLAGFFWSIVVILIYNAVLYLSIKDETYLPYLFYMIGMLLVSFFIKGLGYKYIFDINDFPNLLTTHLGPTTAGIALSRFSLVFLNVKKYTRKGAMILSGFQYVWIVIYLTCIALWYTVSPEKQMFVDIVENYVAGIQSVFCFGLGGFVWFKGYKPAKYYVIGFSVSLSGILIFTLKNLGILFGNNLAGYVMQLGVLIQQIFLSLALADKINIMKKDNEKAFLENERILSEQNQILEIKIKERTNELNEANAVLIDLNEEIIQSMEQLQHQTYVINQANNELQDKNQQLNLQNIKLEEQAEFIKQANHQLEENVLELESINIELDFKNTTIIEQEERLAMLQKMASLDEITRVIAHEMNSPLGSIKGAVQISKSLLVSVMQSLPLILEKLPDEDKDLYLKMLKAFSELTAIGSTKDERAYIRKLTQKLEEYDFEDPETLADKMVKIGFVADYETYVPLLIRLEKKPTDLSDTFSMAAVWKQLYLINNACHKAESKIKALQTFVGNGHDSPEVPVNIHDSISTVLDLYDYYLHRGGQIILNIDPQMEVLARPQELVQVWTGVIMAAMYASQMKACVTIDAHPIEFYAHIEITDNGTGLSPEQLERAFDHGVNTRNTHPYISFAASKLNIENAHGTITLESEKNLTRVTIRLPLINPKS